MTESILHRASNPATLTDSAIVRNEAGGAQLRQVQDVRPILSQNARDREAFDASRVAKNPGGFRHIARIPLVMIAQLRQAGIIEGMTVVDEKRFMQFLSDSQVRKLRTDDGARLG